MNKEDFSILFQHVHFGKLKLKNRFVVAPLTRMRTDITGIPNDLMAKYYSMRSSFGLIITESSSVSPISNCFPGAGNIYNEEQMEGWKKVVQQTHEQGGLIGIQVFHSGRSCVSSQINGETPVAPSPIAIRGKDLIFNEEYKVPKELSIHEIKEIVQQFRKSAELSKQAGFDFIQLHAANGYLVDQFLRDESNKRTDEYGGSIENRCRFLFEIIDQLIDVFTAGRVAIRLSPNDRFNDMYDSNPLELMRYVLSELDKRELAFVELKRDSPYETTNSNNDPPRKHPRELIPDFFRDLRKFYQGNIVCNDGVNLQEAKELISQNICHAVSLGTLSISNPDLPIRIQNNYEINQHVDINTWFFGGAKGYTDYLPYKETQK
ncbi:hypothetical protein ABPG72_002891 [Tetrahymena utriculariae]